MYADPHASHQAAAVGTAGRLMVSVPWTRPAYLNTADAARHLGLSAWTLIRWRTRRIGPPFTRMGTGLRGVRYSINDLNRWAERRRVDRATTGKEILA